ncbi:MAG: hypothetical protein H8F28_18310 [Fibrella sp.]|nr:hypothetical protein [Armatimonadota bacterium]
MRRSARSPSRENSFSQIDSDQPHRGCIRLTHPDKEKLKAIATLIEMSLGGGVRFDEPRFGKYNEWVCYARLPDGWDQGEPA